MNATKMWLAGVLLAAVGAWAFWYGSGGPAGTVEPAGSVPETPPQTSAPTAGEPTPAQAMPPAVPSPAVAGANGDETAPTSGEPPDPERESVLDELASEIASIALERLGDPYVGYLVENGLPRADAEPIVTTGFHAASRCWLEAMREQARAETVELDTVLYALHAELYETDGPILSSVIDLQAVAVRQAPCALDALQETGIPPSVAREIQREAMSR